MNPYLILGVPMTASPDDIKNAYRRLAKLSHPDINKNAGAAEKFIEIKKAYEMLSGKEPRVQPIQQQRPVYHEQVIIIRYGGWSWSSGTAGSSSF